MAIDIKFKEKNNFEKSKNKELNLTLDFSFNSNYKGCYAVDELKNIDLPKNNCHIHCITTKRRNSDIFIEWINPSELIVVNSRLKKSKILDNIKNKTIYANDSKDYDIISIRNHAKILVCDNYVIIGSGNISVNARIENYVIFNNNNLARKIKKELENSKQASKFTHNLSTSINVQLPEREEQIFYFKNRNFCPLDILKKIKSEEQILNITIIGFRISKKSIKFLDDFNVQYRFSDSLKYMCQDIFKLLYERNSEFDNYHRKQIFIKTKENNYIITSSNNIDTDDNLDFCLIENSVEIYNDVIKS